MQDHVIARDLLLLHPTANPKFASACIGVGTGEGWGNGS